MDVIKSHSSYRRRVCDFAQKPQEGGKQSPHSPVHNRCICSTRNMAVRKDIYFCSRLSQAMQKRGIDQLPLAKALGVSGPAVSNWLTGKCIPRKRLRLRLCTILEVSEEWLVSGIGSPAIAQNLLKKNRGGVVASFLKLKWYRTVLCDILSLAPKTSDDDLDAAIAEHRAKALKKSSKRAKLDLASQL